MGHKSRREKLFELQLVHHRESFRKRLEDGSVEVWLREDNADYWGNRICLAELEPFFSSLPRSRILTIGDGKGGKEAAFLKKLGHHAVASDICTEVLAEARRRGIIDEFCREDAEALSLPDDSFDYALVKESLHHMQRPYLAIHEMLRVAGEGVVIIEPHGSYSARFAVKFLMRDLLVRCLKVGKRLRLAVLPEAKFEPSGNYVYRFQPCELAQVAIAAGCEAYAYGYSHFYYRPGCGKVKGEALKSLIAAETRRMAKADAKYGVERRPMLDFIMFKKSPAPKQIAALRSSGMLVTVSGPHPRL